MPDIVARIFAIDAAALARLLVIDRLGAISGLKGTAASALSDQVESPDRKEFAPIQKLGACPCRKSGSIFPGHALGATPHVAASLEFRSTVSPRRRHDLRRRYHPAITTAASRATRRASCRKRLLRRSLTRSARSAGSVSTNLVLMQVSGARGRISGMAAEIT
jgi:hypothetical protein